MATTAGSNISCGVHQLWGLYTDPKKNLTAVQSKGECCRFYMFSDKVLTGGSAGEILAKEIEDKKLGTLVQAGPMTNPNSGNPIKVWTYAPDFTALAKYVKVK